MCATDFGDSDPISVLAEIANLVPTYASLNQEVLEDNGLQLPWALPECVLPSGLAPLQPRVAGAQQFLFAPGRVLAMPGNEVEIIRSNGRNAIRREDALEIHPEDAASLGVAPGEIIEIATITHRIRGVARTTGDLRGVVSATVLFGELATALDASNDYDPMLRIPGLHVMPVWIEKITS